MYLTHSRSGAALVSLAVALIGPAVLTTPVRAQGPADELARARELIKPGPGEARWLEIPWEIDVWQARKKAAAEGKPIFFLTGGGASPLGDC